VELVVADSGSSDGSRELARSFGATVINVERFSHGGTRNLLMERSRGDRVVFLTQDAVPAHARWLASLLDGFELAADVALVYGPYRARAGAPVAVARELRDWFAAIAPAAGPRVDRGADLRGPGAATYFSDANGAVSRAAWQHVPFRDVPYAEDQALALDMLRAGYAKAYVPDAAVIHSHSYGPLGQFRRSFDEWRALREIYGWVEPSSPRRAFLTVQSRVRADVRSMRASERSRRAVGREALRSLRHWTIREAGAVVGSRADRLPPAIRRWCSLERRS
jgi:rhamnosyltransferase